MRKINIKGQDYEVLFLNDSQMAKLGYKNYAGLCHKHEKKIYVNSNQSKSEQLKTLYHEICHALCEEVGLCQIISDPAEQILCEAFSSFIWTEFYKKKYDKRKANKSL